MKILNVLYQSNDNYAVVTGVSIASLLENNKKLDEINIYLLNDSITKKNLDRLQSLCKKYKNRNLIIVDTSDILKQLKEMKVVPHQGTYTTYFKLMAASELKLKTDLLLQLDGDTIINDSLEELCDMDLGDCVCAATYDCLMNDYKKLIGIPLTDKYYNCGVLLINQKNWIEQDCKGQIINHLLHVRNAYHIVDQDIINVLFRHKIKYLSLTYNYNSGFYIYGVKESIKLNKLKPEFYFTEEEIMKYYDHPKINHCMIAAPGRPWEENNYHPQNALYDHYLAMTPWKDEPKKIVKRGAIFRVQMFLYKHLPRKLYIPIHAAGTKYYLFKQNKKAVKKALDVEAQTDTATK